jgi:hypothetical protein
MFYRNLGGTCAMQTREKTGFSIGSQTSYLGGIAPKGHCCLDDRTILTFSSPSKELFHPQAIRPLY